MTEKQMELLIEQSIFSILYRDKNKNEIRHVGTGVVVCKKGIFITAGHTFRQKGDFKLEDFRACFIVNGNIYITPIKEICWDSIDFSKQKVPEFKDYAVGQLLNPIRVRSTYKRLYIKRYIYLKIRKKQPLNLEKLYLYAYEYKDPKTEDRSLGDNFANIDIDKIHLMHSQFLVIKNEIVIPPDKAFNNCSSLRGKAEATNSGAPMFDENMLIRGVLLEGITGIQGKDADCKFVNMCRSKYYANRIKDYNTAKRKCKNYQIISGNGK